MPTPFPFEDEYFDILSKARTGLGLALDEIARKSKTDPVEIQAMEAGAATPNPESLARVAAALELSPDKLVDFALRPAPPQPVKLPHLSFCLPPVGSFAANAYILSCPSTRACAIVDPGAGAASIRRLVEENRLRPECMLLTHGHGDHVEAVREIAEAFGIRAIALERERAMLGGYPADFAPPRHSIAIGNLEVSLDEVPGHTAGGAAIQVPLLGLVCSGDSLFARSVGRCRGPAAAYRSYLKTIRNVILDLPPPTVICPGHGPLSRVIDEQELNPFFP